MRRPGWFSAQFLRQWVWVTLSLASGGPTVVLALWFLLLGREPPKATILVLLQICSVTAAWIAWLQEHKARLDTSAKERPRLIVRPGDFFETTRYWRMEYEALAVRGQYGLDIPFSCLILRISNDPDTGTAKSLATVSARLTFFHGDDELLTIDGRWGDTPQPPRLASNQVPTEFLTVEVPIGMSRELNMAIKYHTEHPCYAFNNDSYGFPDLKNAGWALGQGEYSVLVRVRGVNVDASWRLRFRNPASTAPLEVISCEAVSRQVQATQARKRV